MSSTENKERIVNINTTRRKTLLKSIGGNSSLTYSSRENPCPVCGRAKDRDCSFREDLTLVNCHTYAKESTPQFINGYRFTGKFCDTGIHGDPYSAAIYVLENNQQKTTRPRQRQEFIYHDVNGMPVVKVVRTDDGQGGRSFYQKSIQKRRWDNGVPEVVHSRIHLYRIFDPRNQQAISSGERILIVEGEGKADLLLRMGIPATCSLGGAGKWRKYGYANYLNDLKGASIVICPDRDLPGLKHANDIAQDFPTAQWLYAFPDDPIWNNLPSSGGLDVADWIAEGQLKADDVLAAIQQQRSHVGPQIQTETVAEDLHRLEKDNRLIEAKFANQLRFNTLLNQVELNGEAFDLGRAKIEFIITHKLPIKSAREDVADLALRLAKQHSYSPVVEYLDRVHKKHGSDPSAIDGMAQRYLGTDEPLHQLMLRKFLISAVARAYQPGCKADCTLILQGRQGYGKSTFFRVLASEPWFDDSLGAISEKDEKLKLHRSWFIEWAELETVFGRKGMSQVKAFLSSSTDLIRPPYGRSIETMKRASVIVGTTNQQQFLPDPTGNRRFWVIPVANAVDRVMLQSERDRIWASAVALFKAGEQWWMADEVEQSLQDDRARHESRDVWADAIEPYLRQRDCATMTEILKNVIGLDTDRQDKAAQNRVRDILFQLGWQAPLNTYYRKGIKGRFWTAPAGWEMFP